MAYTENNNLPVMPSGAVDGVALFNDLGAKVEKMPGTVYLENSSGSALTQGMPFYIHTDGTAKAALSTTEQQGLWDSVSTANGANGFGRIGGVITKTGWGLTVGSYYYVHTDGTLITTPTNNAIGFAISATEMIVHPFKK